MLPIGAGRYNGHRPLCEIDHMHWRKIIIGAVLGGLLGFIGQLSADFFWWPSPIDESNRTCYEYVFCGTPDDERVGRTLESCLRLELPPEKRNQGRLLFFEGIFLFWLQERWKFVGQTVLIGAFLGASSVLAADQISQKRLAKKLSTLS